MANEKKHEHQEDDMIEQDLTSAESEVEQNGTEPAEATDDGLQKALDEQKDKYMRLFAEFDNYKRRTSKEMIDLRLTASKDIIVSLLDVLDDMDRAEAQMENSEDATALKEGTLLIFNKLRRILESKGLKALDTLHTEFDVEKDEAISETPVQDENLKGKVVAEVQKGYLLNDKLIRYAKVVVGK